MSRAPLDRRAVVASLLADRREDLLVVTGLGSPSYDVMAAGDDPRNFYLWAAMGSAATVGLGLALAQPKRRVLVITGDGEMLMGMGALATIAGKRPRNLAVVVLDNRLYGETGSQPSHTARGVRLEAVGAACGIPVCQRIADAGALAGLKQTIDTLGDTTLAIVEVAQETPERVLPPRDGAAVKVRFRAALGLPGY